MMKNKIFKKMLVMLLILSMLAVFTACSKDGADNAQNDGTTADAGDVQNSSNKAKGFDMNGKIVTVDGKTVYKDYTSYPQKVDFYILDEKTGEKEKLDIDVNSSALMCFTGEKLYLTISYSFEYMATEGFLEYDITTKSSRVINLAESDSNMAKPIYVDNNYIYYYILKGPDGPYDWIKHNLENGETINFLPETASLAHIPEGTDFSYADNLIIYSIEERGQNVLYSYNFEKDESYKISDSGEYLYCFNDRVYYLDNESTGFAIRSCDLQGKDNKLVKNFELNINPWFITGAGNIVYVNATEGAYEINLQSGEYIKSSVLDEIDIFLCGDEMMFGLCVENSENFYEYSEMTVYDLNNGIDNKKVIADKLFDPYVTIRVKDGKLYCVNVDYETRESELKIIPLK